MFEMEHSTDTDPRRNLIDLPKAPLFNDINCQWPFWMSFAFLIAGFVLLAGYPYSIGIQIFLPIFIISQCIPCCWYIICTKETFSNAWTENAQQKPSFESFNFELLDSFDTDKTFNIV